MLQLRQASMDLCLWPARREGQPDLGASVGPELGVEHMGLFMSLSSCKIYVIPRILSV